MRLSLKVQSDGKVAGYFADQLTVREKTNLQSIGGRYNKQLHKWFLPLDIDINGLYGIADSIQFDESVEKYLQEKSSQRITLAKIISGETPRLKYGSMLDDYQKAGVGFLINAKHAILADDAGLGKTLQTIAAFLEINAQKVLVVTKKSLIYNWVYEMKNGSI
ncbi:MULTISPECIES: SNF2-related protein [Thermoanaerobacterium]|uniref:SNF2-related protein n=2 Tax=Thermoanaerobacterium TaxID=28895 RepID=W9EJD1_9THEO|nr:MULTISPECIES: SNF2-related protein [Thermoanaerobacterium]AFK85222.1 SNF2-related protein [Thermoanaerobacterium saccharolyticum JW/SL-YS485]ETO39794.1 SNF2-related protein [Thermoanaerobacterium aotearoense SCUT27]